MDDSNSSDEYWTGPRIRGTNDPPLELLRFLKDQFLKIRMLRIENAPRNWSAADSPPQLRAIGQRWLDAGAAPRERFSTEFRDWFR
jgi:hypothetical protein